MTARSFIINWRSVAETRPTYAYPEFLSNGEGLCSQKGNPDDFTETSTKSYGYAARARAAAVCDECPFKVDCQEWAVGTEQSGVWGGEWYREGQLATGRRRRVRNAA